MDQKTLSFSPLSLLYYLFVSVRVCVSLFESFLPPKAIQQINKKNMRLCFFAHQLTRAKHVSFESTGTTGRY